MENFPIELNVLLETLQFLIIFLFWMFRLMAFAKFVMGNSKESSSGAIYKLNIEKSFRQRLQFE